ncbi:MAG: hypothetical protein PF569_09250 [Candidatus Woesearchaeota archaeon]|jgi:uncharacterized protein YcfL|nr:hypothetical protein [Candidatus Woesearchaeota archaeon]
MKKTILLLVVLIVLVGCNKQDRYDKYNKDTLMTIENLENSLSLTNYTIIKVQRESGIHYAKVFFTIEENTYIMVGSYSRMNNDIIIEHIILKGEGE